MLYYNVIEYVRLFRVQFQISQYAVVRSTQYAVPPLAAAMTYAWWEIGYVIPPHDEHLEQVRVQCMACTQPFMT